MSTHVGSTTEPSASITHMKECQTNHRAAWTDELQSAL
jgi:hypothetical protein